MLSLVLRRERDSLRASPTLPRGRCKSDKTGTVVLAVFLLSTERGITALRLPFGLPFGREHCVVLSPFHFESDCVDGEPVVVLAARLSEKLKRPPQG